MRAVASAGALVLVLVSDNVVRAAPAYGWRDGCPAGDMQSKDDLAYSTVGSSQPTPSSLAKRVNPPYPGTEPAAMGPAADLDSALAPSRAVLAFPQYMHFAGSGDADAMDRARLIGGIAQLQLRVSQSLVPRFNYVGLAVTNAYLAMLAEPGRSDESTASRTLGNTVVTVSLQKYWADAREVPESNSSKEQQSAASADSASPPAAGLRRALAFQLMATAQSKASDTAASVTIMQRTAFDAALFAPYRLFGASAETRVEGVGCYAPFLHVRLASMFTRDQQDAHELVLVPFTLAGGLTVAPNTTLLAEYGVLVSYTSGVGSPSLVGTNALHRLRLGVEYGWSWLSVGLHFDGFLGSPMYDGTALELYVALMPGGIGD